jgi:hypothetical protein
MAEAITLDAAYDRLFELMPDWRDEVSRPAWTGRWMKASGDSRAKAYRMRSLALELDDLLFQAFVQKHPEIPATSMVEAHNAEWGIPCRWKQRQPRLKRVSI